MPASARRCLIAATTLFVCFSPSFCLAQSAAVVNRPTTAPLAADRNTHEMLSAVLWIQTSAEYRFLCEGVYASARDALDRALADPNWTGAIEQTGDFAKLPPAVIMDIDETVLEHSFYQAELVRRGISPNSRMWRDCVLKYRMPAVPGALEFIKYAQSRNVTVFFVTNRELELQDATRRNLNELGIKLPETPDTLMVAGEQGWTSDKTARRILISKSYRILSLFGDDFGDFLPGGGNSVDRRFELAAAHKEMWGRRWFLLPNPLTGSWTSAIMRDAGPLNEMQSLEYRRSLVKGYDSMPLLAPE
jgi:acid phosphatase